LQWSRSHAGRRPFAVSIDLGEDSRDDEEAIRHPDRQCWRPEGNAPRLWKTGITAVSHYSMNASGSSLCGLANRQYPDPVAGGRPPLGRELLRPSFLQALFFAADFQYHDLLQLACV